MFLDREDAGRQLADELKNLALHDPLVLAIPRGGVVTGAALARALGAELDIVLANKLRSPVQPGLAFGAVGEDAQMYLNHRVKELTGVTDKYLQRERDFQVEQIHCRQKVFRAARPAAKIADRSVILTDDGIATGSTMFAAIEVAKGNDPYELIVAVPVAPPDRLAAIRDRCDRLICLHEPTSFCSVAAFYKSFDTVDVEEVIHLLRQFAPATEATR